MVVVTALVAVLMTETVPRELQFTSVPHSLTT